MFSALLGLLVGLEREKRLQNNHIEGYFGGIRTMSLVAIYAYVVQLFFGDSLLLFSIFTAGFLFLVIASYAISAFRDEENLGATSEIAAFFVFLVGVLVARDQVLIATIITMSVALLLYFKEMIHAFVRRIDKKELYDTLKFVVVAFVVLPLLPNEVFGPLEVFNPYLIWLMVVLVSSISFVSYVAIKWLGSKKGIGLSGFLGGLVSSTAVSMSFSQMSKKSKNLVNPFVFGVLIASTAMFFRVLLEVWVLNIELFKTMLLPLVTMGATGLLLSFYYWFAKKKSSKTYSDEDLSLKSPFQLMPALQFALFFAALLFISKFASVHFGDQGVYITSFLSGFVDVDAITVSMANLHRNGDLSLKAATIAITIATMTNTLVKGGIVFFFGSRAVGLRVMSAFFVVIFAGFSSLFFLNIF